MIHITTFGLLLLTLASAPAGQYSLGTNAALQYWQAFVLMPPADTLAEKEKKALEGWRTTPLDAVTQAALQKHRAPMEFLRRGAQFQFCDWGLAPSLKEDGIGANMPHLQKALELSRASCLHARYLFSQGKGQAAFDDLFATLVLARHVGGSGPLLGKTFEYAIEGQVIELAGAHLMGKPDAKTLEGLRVRLDRLPASSSISEVIRRGEKEMYLGWIRTRGLEAVESLIEDLHQADDQKKEVIRTFLGLKEKNLPKLCEAIGKHFDEAAKIAALPINECEAAERTFKKKLNDELETTDPRVLNVFPRLILPPVAKVRFAEAKMEAQRALFRTALTMILEGPAQLKASKDPFGKGPFGFRKLENGFELSSQLTDSDGKPVTLIVGGR